MRARLDLGALREAWTAMGMPVDQVNANLGVLEHRLEQVAVIAGDLSGNG